MLNRIPCSILVCFCLCMRVSSITRFTQYKYPFLDPSLSWNDRVDDLVSRLTIEEVANQTQVDFGDPNFPTVDRLGIKPYVWTTECLRGQATTNSTAFPQSIGMAATFSTSMIFNMTEVISYEMRAHWNGNVKQGIYRGHVGLSCFSPVINILRHPLWGRNQETYGEDPFLSGSLAYHYVKGLQGDHPRYLRASAGCKHFDVHGGPENIPVSRFSFNAQVSTRDWRMTFLPAFKMCVEAGTYSLMCSYNSINGIPACANKQLLTDITRGEWGFTGYVVSDAWAISNIKDAHGYTKNDVDTVTLSMKAGVNLELSSHVFMKQLEALAQGNLTEKELRDNIKPLFYTRMNLGEFDPPEMNPYNKIDMSVVQSPYHRYLALKATMMSFVLLKNEFGFLPLLTKRFRSVAVIGPFANDINQMYGDYSSNIDPEFAKTPFRGLAALGSSAVTTPGCDNTRCNNYNTTEIKTRVSYSDLIIVCLGTGQNVESEGYDRANMDLPGHQLDLLKDAVFYANGNPVILLLFNAGPVDVSWAKNNPLVPVIMECFFPAQSAGDALFAVLTMSAGPHSVPAGRLPSTWPVNINDVPTITDYTMEGRTYRYSTVPPLYPFGYGLSYSVFQYSNLVMPSQVMRGESVDGVVSVLNLGPYDADEVVQVYISFRANTPGLTVPNIQLAAFNRITLNKWEVQHIQFSISSERLAVWVNDDEGFAAFSGNVTVYVGGQQPNQDVQTRSNVLVGSFTVV